VEGEVFEGEIIEEQRTVEKQGQSYDVGFKSLFCGGGQKSDLNLLFQKCDLVNRFVRICGEKMTLVLEVKITKHKSKPFKCCSKHPFKMNRNLIIKS
jgi:hypothetical protein